MRDHLPAASTVGTDQRYGSGSFPPQYRRTYAVVLDEGTAETRRLMAAEDGSAQDSGQEEAPERNDSDDSNRRRRPSGFDFDQEDKARAACWKQRGIAQPDESDELDETTRLAEPAEPELPPMPVQPSKVDLLAAAAMVKGLTGGPGVAASFVDGLASEMSSDGAGDYRIGADSANRGLGEGQRAKAVRILRRQPVLSVGRVAVHGIESLYVWLGEGQSATIGDHYEEVEHRLAALPTDDNLWRLAYYETEYWKKQGGLGARVTAQERYALLLASRDNLLASMSPADRVAAEAELGLRKPTKLSDTDLGSL